MQFDPYHKWLGIPPKDQPPNHYRLLGVDFLESDLEVIDNAADQRSRHIRTFQSGPYQAYSQQLLNEIASARNCLVDRETKSIYDAQFRTEESAPLAIPLHVVAPHDPPLPTEAPALSSSPPLEGLTAPRVVSRARTSAGKNPVVEVVKIIAGGLAGLVLSLLFLSFVREEWDMLGIARSMRDEAAPTENTVDNSQDSSTDTTGHNLPEPSTPPPNSPPPSLPSPNAMPAGPTSVEASMPSAPAVSPPAQESSSNDQPATGSAVPSDSPSPTTSTVFQKGPVPSDADLEEARQSLGVEMTSGNVAQLMASAAETNLPAERFTLLAAARDRAVAEGDIDLSLAVVAKMEEWFEGTWGTVRSDVLNALRKTAPNAAARRRLVTRTMELCEAASKSGDMQLCRQLAEIALPAARESGDTELVKRATLLLLQSRP